MVFDSKNFLFKELVNTFSYTTATQNREAYTNVSINGRLYTKYGTLQAVTFVGNLYRVGIPSEGYLKNDKVPAKEKEKYVLVVGMSKQHPCDTKVNKELGYEIAANNMLTDPCIVIDVDNKFTKRRFTDLVEYYMDNNIKLEFIKTRLEILEEGKDPTKYNR